MKLFCASIAVISLGWISGATMSAQSAGQAAAAPTLVRLDGQLKTPTGEARTGIVAMLVSLYADKDDATPLWVEQQIVTLDAAGRYTLFAGATLPDGVPAEFLSGATAGRWLGVAVQGEAEQFRMMLVTVPYALKAREADTLSGKRLSDFVLTESLSDAAKASLKSQGVGLVDKASASSGGTGPTISSVLGTLLRDDGAGAISATGSAIVDDGAGNTTVRPFAGTASKIRFWNFNGSNETVIRDVGGAGASELVFEPGAIEKMRIKSSGGADIYGNLLLRPLAGAASKLRLWNNTSDSETYVRDIGTPGASTLVFEPGGLEKLRVYGTGGADLVGTLRLKPVSGAPAKLDLWTGTGANETILRDAGVGSASAFVIEPGGVEQMRVTSTGVGIGTTSPLTTLDVAGNIHMAGVLGQGGKTVLTTNHVLSNTAVGMNALSSNTTGNANTATGNGALSSNTTGFGNTATGHPALGNNSTGNFNTAFGFSALVKSTTANGNTAVGSNALAENTTGFGNTATGNLALVANNTGFNNTATGTQALAANTTGFGNTATGTQALSSNTTGIRNTALGRLAGSIPATGSYNIFLGEEVSGTAADTNLIRIGFPYDGTTMPPSGQNRTFIAGIRGITTGLNNAIPVTIDSNGQLGTISSSRRFKEDIRSMGEASRGLLALRPVTFRYQKPFADGSKPLQYGLIAEEVAEVYPDLVARSADGQIETVKYQVLDAMLLNELQRQQAELEALERQNRDLQQRLKMLEAAFAERR